MTKKVLAIFLISTAVWLPSPASARGWVFDLEQAKAQARIENRLVLADFWADWCGPCRTMDVQTWEDPRVRELAGRFVLARVDFGTRGNSVTEYYDVNSIPTLMLLDRKGACLMRVMGLRSPLAMLELLKHLPTSATEAESLTALASSPPPSIDFCLDLATELTNRQLFEVSARVCKKARRLLPTAHGDSLEEELDMLSAMNRVQADPTGGLQGLRDCLARYPHGRHRRDEHAGLVRTLKLLGDQAGAEEALARMRQEFPTDSLTSELDRFLSVRQ